MMPISSQVTPKYPLALMNRHHIVAFDRVEWLNKMRTSAFLKGRFKENAVVIDVNCRKFPVLDVIKLGRSWNPFDLIEPDVRIRIKYIYGEPTQLTFDEARDEIVNLICGRRWHGQTGGNEKSFREQRAACKDMRDFLVGKYGVGFYGKWVL
jgi:hypothetical protein